MTRLLLLVAAIGGFAYTAGWLSCAYYHRYGSYADARPVPRDPHARRALRGDERIGGRL